MKKIIFLALAFVCSTTMFAKKVKFSVDMTDAPDGVHSDGVHVIGDFQKLAGYEDDFDPGITPLAKEGTSNIYSITVDIPANRAYQYKFVNGNLGYLAEYVPDESRYIIPDIDYRWFYLDSVDNGVKELGAIKFGENAPANKFLLRFRVNMKELLPVDWEDLTKRPHIEGSFQGWKPDATTLFAPYDSTIGLLNDTIYEYIAYVDAGEYEYKYINGNSSAKAETVPASCATNGNRSIKVMSDMIIEPVCFASCSNCKTTGIFDQNSHVSKISLFPNPSNEYTIIRFDDHHYNHSIIIRDLTGKVVREYANVNNKELRIDREQLEAGIYFISSQNNNATIASSKWIIQ